MYATVSHLNLRMLAELNFFGIKSYKKSIGCQIQTIIYINNNNLSYNCIWKGDACAQMYGYP